MIGSIGLAERAGLSDVVIGLTVIAIGTSLPELAAGVSGALKGHADISIGNVVGSNVFNVLGVIGVVGTIHPFGGPADPETQAKIAQNVAQDFPVVMAFSLAAILVPLLGGAKGGRFKGLLLVGAWLAYTIYLIGWSS
jgi:cation:H+ antiporter